MRFDLFNNVKAKAGRVCDAHLFDQAIADPRVARLCQQIADEPDKERQQTLKKQLPIATFNASFGGKPRKNDNAIPSGLCSVDIDDLEHPYKAFCDQVYPCLHELDVRLAYMTPSQHGLRVVFVRDATRPTIADNMAWFEQLTGLHCDPACKDLARASYLVPESYIYYRENSMFNDECGIMGQNPVGATLVVARPDECPRSSIVVARPDECPRSSIVVARTDDAQKPSKQIQSTFKGLKLSDIANEWLNQNGGTPAEGERNNVLHRLAYSLRYITDFRPEPILHAIPHCGLTDAEVMSLCQSACNAPRSTKMPFDLQRILNGKCKVENGELSTLHSPLSTNADDDDPHDEEYLYNLPKLPIGLKESMEGVPDKVKMPILCGIMPLAMTYATKVQVRYCDGKMQRLNAMTVIYGTQASGKSAVKDVIDVWKQPMKELDTEAREREDEFKRLRKNRKANEKLPEEPRTVIIEVPITISCSTLLKRQKNARGQHNFSFGEELDTLRKTNGAGSWSSKYDVYRLSFDNGEWGQDYNSDQAESGVVNVAYNWTVLGTLGAVMKCFKSDNVENGMGGRVLFSKMPSRRYEYMPTYKELSADVKDRILEAVHILANSSGYVDTPRLRNAMQRWCDGKADEARRDNDIVVDTFRKRAAVIGFRCGVVFHLLESGGHLDALQKESRGCVQFAQIMADYALKYQCELFGQQIIDNVVVAIGTHNSKNKSLFNALGPSFTMDDLVALRPDSKLPALKKMVYRWMRDGLAEKVDDFSWTKAKAG